MVSHKLHSNAPKTVTEFIDNCLTHIGEMIELPKARTMQEILDRAGKPLYQVNYDRLNAVLTRLGEARELDTSVLNRIVHYKDSRKIFPTPFGKNPMLSQVMVVAAALKSSTPEFDRLCEMLDEARINAGLEKEAGITEGFSKEYLHKKYEEIVVEAKKLYADKSLPGTPSSWASEHLDRLHSPRDGGQGRHRHN